MILAFVQPLFFDKHHEAKGLRHAAMESSTRTFRVLVVDDESSTAQAHASFVSRIPGFEVQAIAHTGSEAIAALAQATAAGSPIDLVLLDMNLPDLHGLDVARRVRGKGDTVDIIAITAIRDLNVVRTAIATGVTQYLIKPFTFAAFSEKLTNYREFRLSLGTGGTSTSQASIDNAFAALRSAGPAPLPKGLIPETLAAIGEVLKSADSALSATEVSESLGLSRVTARRYLEHLAETNEATKAPRHGTRGRPEYEYRWRTRS